MTVATRNNAATATGNATAATMKTLSRRNLERLLAMRRFYAKQSATILSWSIYAACFAHGSAAESPLATSLTAPTNHAAIPA
jgi:hypothetical protein